MSEPTMQSDEIPSVAWLEKQQAAHATERVKAEAFHMDHSVVHHIKYQAALRALIEAKGLIDGGRVVSSSSDPCSLPVVLLDKSEVDAWIARWKDVGDE